MQKLIIIQTCTPDYRAGFFKTLRFKLPNKFDLYSGNQYFEETIQSDRSIKSIKLKNYFFLRRKFLFQTGLWHLLFSKHILILELNPRILSNWMFLIIRRFFGKKTILWGHAWPRAGASSKSDVLRHFMREMGDSIIVYTQTQRDQLKIKMPKKDIFAAPNALLSEIMISNKQESASALTNFIYVGRLATTKKVMFLVKAFKESLKVLPQETKLYIVGEGEERKAIELYLNKHNLTHKIILKGHIAEYDKLEELYSKSIFSISPGYGGLSITQSFSFGVPILISETEPHSPEIEAIQEGFNAEYYKTDDIEDFKKKILTIIAAKEKWIEKRSEIAEFCKENYTVESMAEVFTNIYNQYEG